MSRAGLIDVHHHIVPPAYRAAFEKATDGTIGGIPQPPWSHDAMLDRMADLGIDRAVLSISAPALGPIAPEARPALAASCNATMADLARSNPGRIGGFAVLPMPDVEQSIGQIAYALDELKLDGVSLLTNYDGRYLGDEAFAPVLAELDRRAAVVHVHPNLPPEMPAAKLAMPAPVLEFTFDTTRMIAELILTETLQRYSRLKMVLSHLGGTLPLVAWRLSMLDDFPSAVRAGGVREPVRDQLRRLYYDVALSADPAGLRLAADVVGTDRLLYGSDFPFAPAGFIDRNTEVLTADAAAMNLVAITRDNAEQLFG